MLVEVGELQIERDALGEHQAFGAPLLRHEAEPRLDRLGRGARRERLAVQRHAAGIGPVRAIDQPRQFAPAGADQAANAQHLARDAVRS